MRPTQRHHVVIAGNIGVGKSTLVSLLADALGWQPFYELEGEHPYLADYYENPQRWGFHSQIWFLTRRYSQHQAIAAAGGPVVQDRSIYEDAEVFARSLRDQAILSERDYTTYRALYQALTRDLSPPSLVVYLRAGMQALERRINGRARPYEREIPRAYLRRIASCYEAWVASWQLCPVLTVNTDDLDYVRDPTARRAIIEQIAGRLI